MLVSQAAGPEFYFQNQRFKKKSDMRALAYSLSTGKVKTAEAEGSSAGQPDPTGEP